MYGAGLIETVFIVASEVVRFRAEEQEGYAGLQSTWAVPPVHYYELQMYQTHL